MSSKQLHLYPEALRDTVEKILAIFSNDPLSGLGQIKPVEDASNLFKQDYICFRE